VFGSPFFPLIPVRFWPDRAFINRMHAMDDTELLREYALCGSESAFGDLVSRRIGLVYSAALRQVRDPHLADEITQAVFIILSKKAGKIRSDTKLAGWLFKTTHYAAMAQRRAAARRRFHELEAQLHSEIPSSTPDPLWEKMSPFLDAALDRLGEKDRQAVLLRFFENKSLAEVGHSLGAGEDAARMRINRALGKLRRFFLKRGIVSTNALIGEAITANCVQTAPSGLATTITATAAKASAVAASTMTLVKGTLNIMAWIKSKTAIVISAGTALAGAAVLTLHQQEEQNRGQEEQIRGHEQQVRLREQQANLSVAQRGQLENQMNQLRAEQNKLRVAQSNLYEQDPNPFARTSVQISPFTNVRFQDGKAFVTYEGIESELASIHGVSTSDILDFCRRQYKDEWQKRFAEDLLVVLADMGHPINGEHTVSLVLIDPATGQTNTVENAQMTAANRRAIHQSLVNAQAAAAAPPR
jgi:RNA polymerase sigma factor (sigma-70 family)